MIRFNYDVGGHPTWQDLGVGEFEYNVPDGKLFTVDKHKQLINVGGNATVSGSNANGNWIKFGDGTMIQYGEAALDYSGGYKQVAGKTITFPTQFISDVYYASGMLNDDPPTVATREKVISIAKAKTASGFLFKYYASSNTDLSPLLGKMFNWEAVGRWK